MLTAEMLQIARDHGVALGKTASAELLKAPALAAKVDRLATGIVTEFAALMKQGGLAEDDIAVLCETLILAYRSELPIAATGTKH